MTVGGSIGAGPERSASGCAGAESLSVGSGQQRGLLPHLLPSSHALLLLRPPTRSLHRRRHHLPPLPPSHRSAASASTRTLRLLRFPRLLVLPPTASDACLSLKSSFQSGVPVSLPAHCANILHLAHGRHHCRAIRCGRSSFQSQFTKLLSVLRS